MKHAMVGPTRSSRIARISSVLLAFGSCLLLAMPAARADCPVTDLSCVTEPVDDTVETVEETVETVEPVDDTIETVEETVEPVVETVVETVEETVQTIEETVGIVEETLDPPADEAGSLLEVLGESVVASEVSSGPAREGGTGAESSTDGDPAGAGSDGRPIGDTVRPASPIGSSAPATPSGSAGAEWTDPSDDPERFGGFFANVVAGFAFPVVLGLVVGAFVAAQNRLDRRDPKLALAPVGPDVLSFA